MTMLKMYELWCFLSAQLHYSEDCRFMKFMQRMCKRMGKRKGSKFKYELGQVVQLQVGLEGLHVQGWVLWRCPQAGNQNGKKCEVASRLVVAVSAWSMGCEVLKTASTRTS